MLNPLRASLLTGLFSLSVSAQVICTLGPGAAAYKPAEDQRPTNDTMQLVNRVNAAVKTICKSNCPGVAVFRNTTAANAMLIAEGNQAKLAYSPAFFATVNESYGDAGIIAIIAHEVGHALDDVMGAAWIKNGWTPELRADSWAGCALARTDLNPADTQAALTALAKYPSPAHPSWTVRLPAVRAGYTACGGDNSRFDSGSRGVRK
jgi:hypothetical protein